MADCFSECLIHIQMKKKDALVFKLTQFVFPCLEFYTFNDNYEIYFSLYKEVVTQ